MAKIWGSIVFNRRTGNPIIDDSINALSSAIDERVNDSFGRVVYKGQGSNNLSVGELAVVDSNSSDRDLRLPSAKTARVGDKITVFNEGPNVVYVNCQGGDFINVSWKTYPIPPRVGSAVFVLSQKNRWLVIGAPRNRVWCEWNKIDTSQVEANSSGATVTSATLSVNDTAVKSLRLTTVATSTTFLTSLGWVFFKRRAPTPNYRVHLNFTIQNSGPGSPSTARIGIVSRWQNATGWYTGHVFMTNYRWNIGYADGAAGALNSVAGDASTITDGGSSYSVSLATETYDNAGSLLSCAASELFGWRDTTRANLVAPGLCGAFCGGANGTISMDINEMWLELLD